MLKEKLKKNQVSIGTWITLGHSSVIDIMASAGFEWFALDHEHSLIDYHNIQPLINACKLKNKEVLVRIGKNDDLIIKKVLDAGADGIIVPMIKSADEAKKAVASVYYAPKGNRGVGLSIAQNYGIGFEEYKDWHYENLIVIAQIEHIDAVQEIEAILLTEGIDGVIIGPYDLSASLGVAGELEHPQVLQAIKKVETACKKLNKPLGFHVIKPQYEQVIEKIKAGYNLIGFSLDFYFLGEKCRYEMRTLKEFEK